MSRTPLPRLLSLLLLALILGSYGPSGASAQTEPPPTPAPTTTSSTADSITAGEALDQAALERERSATPEAVPALPTVEAISDAPSDEGQAPELTRGVQGAIGLDVSTTNGVRAGGYITYTYSFTNTTTAPVNNIIVQAWWTDFSATSTSANQYCTKDDDGKNCDVLPGSMSSGLAIAKASCPTGTTPSSSICYNITSLGAKATGKFSVRLGVRKTLYPQANKTVQQLSGSAKLLQNNNATLPVSDDTASTLVVGPVLDVTKANVTQGSIYTGENGTYTITIGNATSSKDKGRADARTATKIVVVDTMPIGATFVSSNPPPQQSSATEVRWEFNGPLNPGASLPPIQVTFKKVGGSIKYSECIELENRTMRASSAEYPIDTTGQTFAVFNTAATATIPVVVPLLLRSVEIEPTSPKFGDRALVTITVENYWPQRVQGAKLAYDVQSNAVYTNDPATNRPPPTSVVNNRLEWVFDINAGNKTTPTVQTFSFTITGKFTKQVTPGTGKATLTVPAGLAADCTSIEEAAGFVERLEVTKTSEEEATVVGSDYYVRYGQEFEYILTVTNEGTTDATDVDINDTFPSNNNAQFSYVAGSTKINGAAAPDPFSAANGLAWTGMQLPAGGQLEIRYRLKIVGDDYVQYCNKAEVISHVGSDVETAIARNNKVCVRIYRDIKVSKTVDKPTVEIKTGGTPAADREVRFTLLLTNNEATPYTVNMWDYLKDFQYVGPVAFTPDAANPNIIDAGTPTYDTVQKAVIYPLKQVNPGQTLKGTFIARVPDVCASKDYVNVLRFHNSQGYIIKIVPKEPSATVRAVCGVEYTITPDRAKVSLRDKVNFEIRLKNTTAADASGLVLENRMPEGFTFNGVSTGSAIMTAPTQSISGTFTTLKWTSVSVKANTEIKIKFQAISGDLINDDTLEDGSWVRLVSGGACRSTSNCIADPLGGTLYYSAKIDVRPLVTMLPRIVEPGCVLRGGTRTYELSVINKNVHAYNSTMIVVSLPPGLEYVNALSDTPAPTVVQLGNKQTLTWNNQLIQAAPTNSEWRKSYQVQLKVNNAIGALRAVEYATSPDGTIPRQENVVDPTIFVCLNNPAMVLWADRVLVKAGDEANFQILLANPKATPFTVSLEQLLPAGLTFSEYTGGQNGVEPMVDGDTLTWDSVTVPPAVGTTYGLVYLNFKVTVNDDAKFGAPLTTRATIVSRNPADTIIDAPADQTTVTLRVARDYFLPTLGRSQ